MLCIRFFRFQKFLPRFAPRHEVFNLIKVFAETGRSVKKEFIALRPGGFARGENFFVTGIFFCILIHGISILNTVI